MCANQHPDSPGRDALTNDGLRKVFRHQRQQDQARQQVVAAAESIVSAQQLEAQQALVPQMVEELLNLISELYNLYRIWDAPDFKEAALIEIVDHEVKAQQDAETSNRWHRLRKLFTERYYARRYYWLYELERTPTRQLSCWIIGWIERSETTPFATIYLEVEKGRIYTTSLTNTEQYNPTADTVSAEQLHQLSYRHVVELSRRIQNKIDWVKMCMRDREVKRTLNGGSD